LRHGWTYDFNTGCACTHDALQELRKAASQQMREVAVSQSEAVRVINDEKLAAERREGHLKVAAWLSMCVCVFVCVCI